MKRIIYVAFLVGFVAFSLSGYASDSSSSSTRRIKRYYYVKGMKCAGCVYGVKAALRKAGISDKNIKEASYKEPYPDKQIGHVLIELDDKEYKGKETDCKIIRSIKSYLGYTAYMTPKDTNPCNL